jgi:hypothetical protein
MLYILEERIHNYTYPISSHAFYRTLMSLKENTYFVEDIKFGIT